MVDDLFDIVGDDAVVLRVHAQPGAGRTAVAGRHGSAVKVRVAAPPQGGRANEACRLFLAETFGVPADRVSLSGGASARAKRFRIDGVAVAEFARLLERTVEHGNAGGGPEVRQTGR